MFDTVTFRVTRPLIKVGSPIHIEGKASDTAGRFFIAEGDDGSEVHLRFGMIHKGPGAQVRISKHGVFITTSLARRWPYAGPNIEPPRTPDECRDRLNELADSLAEIGLVFDPMEGGLSRLDLMKDVPLRFPYVDLGMGLLRRGFDVMSPADESKRLPFGEPKRRSSQRQVGRRTYGVWSPNRAFVVYDKLAQLSGTRATSSFAVAVREETGAEGVARFECRYLNGRAVKGGLGVSLGAHLVEFWNPLASRFKDVVDRHIGTSGAKGFREEGAAQAAAGMEETETVERDSEEERFEASLRRALAVHGRGSRAIMAALAREGLRAMGASGQDPARVRALCAASGIRQRDLNKAFGDLQAVIAEEDDGDGPLDSYARSLAGLSFAWPEMGRAW